MGVSVSCFCLKHFSNAFQESDRTQILRLNAICSDLHLPDVSFLHFGVWTFAAFRTFDRAIPKEGSLVSFMSCCPSVRSTGGLCACFWSAFAFLTYSLCP